MLSHEQVKVYCKLPDAWRDLWLDNGGEIGLLTDLCADVGDLAAAIADAGLERIIDADSFGPSLRFAWQLALKRVAHHRVPNIDDYIKPLTEIRLGRLRLRPPADVLDCLPCKVSDGAVEVLLSAKEWAKILRDAARTSDPKRLRHGFTRV